MILAQVSYLVTGADAEFWYVTLKIVRDSIFTELMFFQANPTPRLNARLY